MDRWNGTHPRPDNSGIDPPASRSAETRGHYTAAKIAPAPQDSRGYHLALSRLHAITMRLVHETDYHALLHAIVEAGIELTHAQNGTLQLYDKRHQVLQLAAHRGFDQAFVDFFAKVDCNTGSCGRSMKEGRRVVVEDVAASESFRGTPGGEVLQAARVRACQSTPIWGRDGTLLGMLSTHWDHPHRPDERELWLIDLLVRQAGDLIEYKRNEETLSYQARLLDIAGDAIVAVDPQRRITYWNAGAAQMYGWSAAEAVGRGADAVLGGEEALEEKVERMVRMRRGEVTRGEFIHHRRDGTRFWVELTARAFADADGVHRGFLAVIRDIGQRKDSERYIAYQAHLLGMANDAIVALDAQRCVTFWNPAAERMYGWTPEEVMGKTLEAALRPIKDVNEKTQTQSRFRPGDTVRGEYLHHRKDGSQLWVESTICAFFDEQGRISGYVAVNRNISDRKRAEEDLRRIRDELERRVAERTAQVSHRAEQLAELSSQLVRAEQRERHRLARVLHDSIQQLLVAAKLGLDVVRKRAPEGQLESIERVAHLLDESINASRSLTVDLSPPVLHEGDLVGGLEWLAHWMQDKYGLSVRLDTARYSGAESEDARILVFQAVRELLFNIVKHAGIWEGRVTLESYTPDALRVTVYDGGRGFDPACAKPSVAEGGGYGLFSIRERLGLLNGVMDVRSAPGEGATFTLTVPRERPTRGGVRTGDACHGSAPSP